MGYVFRPINTTYCKLLNIFFQPRFEPVKYRVGKEFRVPSKRFPNIATKRGRVTFEVGLSKTAFAPGELVKMDICIKNVSKVLLSN